MPPNHENLENMNFAEFLAAQMREKGISLKRLSESTGIAHAHLESLLHGNFENLPPTPYFRGYLVRLGKALGFDGEEWWKRIRNDRDAVISNSGPADALPHNRFIKKSPPKWIWFAGAAAVLIVIYISLTLPRILGKPSVTITFPTENPYTTSSSSIVITGMVRDADMLSLDNGNTSSIETISIGAGGFWEKTVLLQTGLNTFNFHARKFLGSETQVSEQILYEPVVTSSSPTSTTSTPQVHFPSSQPATGTYYE